MDMTRSPRQESRPSLVELGFGLTFRAARLARTGAAWYERQLLSLLRTRMETLPSRSRETVVSLPANAREELGRRLGLLLDAALLQNTASGHQELFHKVLDQIVPDEARILGALSDGSVAPLLHVYRRTRAGLVREVVLENMSLIGKTANLALPHLTPTYVSHLLSLGLVETGPEDSRLKDEYEILAADSMVLRAIKKAARGPIPAHVERYSLRLSALGSDLWLAGTQGTSR